MDSKDLVEANKRLGDVICKELKEFEKISGMQVTGIKIKRLDNAAVCPEIEYVTVKVVIPEPQWR